MGVKLGLILREEHRMRVSETRAQRRIFGPKMEEMSGGWRRLHNEELHYLGLLPNIIRVIKSVRMRWARHVACMGEMRNEFNILVGKPEGKRPPGRPSCRWEDDIRIYLREIMWEGVDWVHLDQKCDYW
jgi:hypothetical protein